MKPSHLMIAAGLAALSLMLGAAVGIAHADSRSPHFRISRDAAVTASASAASANFSSTLSGGTGTQTPPQSSAGFSSTGGDPAEPSTQIFRAGFE